MKNHYVFISYSTKNKKEAEEVRDVLSEKGIICWMAPDSIPFGSNYSTEIFDAVSDCFVFILMLSKESMNSEYVSKELDLAVSNHRYIIPVKLDGENQTNTFRFYLCNVQIIPIDDSVRQTAERLADFIIRRCHTAASDGEPKLLQKFEKPSVNILPNKDAIERLEQLFEINNMVCISGMGGMGKSELAKTYIQSLMSHNKLDTISCNSCPGSIRQAIAMIPFEDIDDKNLIEKDTPAKLSDTDILSILYKKKLSLLKKLNRETVLIFDGMNQFDYEGMGVLNQLSCRVLVTTRLHFDEYPELRMEQFMTFEMQKKMFLQYYEDFSGSDEDMAFIEKIIKAVGNHVLTIKLIALYLNTTGIAPEELYHKLFGKGSVVLNGDEKVTHKHSYHTIDEHISQLFQMSDLSAEEKRVMYQLSYIPDSGISKRQFRLWTPVGTMTFVDQLIKKGWIQNNKGIIGLHPIIHSIIRKNRPESTEDSTEFFNAIIAYLNMPSIPTIPERQNAAFLAEYLANEVAGSNLLTARLYLALGRYLNDYTYWLLFGARNTNQYTYFTQAHNKDKKFMDQFSSAESYLKKALQICVTAAIGNENGIQARIYSNLGATYFNMGLFSNAVTCHQKALELRTEELGEGHTETLTSRRRLGASHLELQDYEAAFACYQKNLEILTASHETHVNISKANYDCGKVFAYQGESEKALAYFKSAICELEQADSETLDPLGAAQLYYMSARLLIAFHQSSASEQVQNQALDLLRKAESYNRSLDSDASDELETHIKELQAELIETGQN